MWHGPTGIVYLLTDMASGFFRQAKDYFEKSRWPLWTLLALCIGRLWLVPLNTSFWVDELVTAFVVKYPRHPSFAIAPQVPQSIYYWLPRAALAISGPSEVSFRFPSMLAMAMMLWLLSLLAARLIHPAAGWFAVFAALSLRGIDYHAVDARPYALGMMMAAASLFFLIRWLDSARWLDAAAFALTAALVWRVHLLYWPFYIVIAIYAAARLLAQSTARTRTGWLQWIVVASATALALLPQAISALRLARNAQSHVIVVLPTLHVFEHELRWNVPLLCGLAAWVAFALPRIIFKSNARSKPAPDSAMKAEPTATQPVAIHPAATQATAIQPAATHSTAIHPAATQPTAMHPSGWILILSWWLCHPVCLYLYSQLTGNSVYLGRYLSLMLPGLALAATACVSLSMPAPGASGTWRIAAAGMAVAALIAQGHWESPLFRHDSSDWRTAVQETNRFAPESSTPVIVPSPFIEARPPAWTPEYPLPGFLYAHLDRYPIAGTPYLFPFDSPAYSPDSVRYAEALLSKGSLKARGKFAIYGPERHVRDWRKWLAQRPELADWSNTLQRFGDVYVAEFWR